VLTHELVAAVCVVGGFVVLHASALAWRWTGPGPHQLGDALRASLGGVVAVAAGAQGFAWFAHQSFGCASLGTGLYLWITWVPLGLVATVVGLAAGRSGWGPLARTAVFLLAAGLAAGHDELQGRMGARIVDPFLGIQAYANQRAGMELPTVQLLQRLWLLGVGGSMYATLAWRHLDAAPWRRAATWGWLAMTAAAVGFGSRIGVGFDRSSVHDVLDGVHSTPHFRIHYDRTGRSRHQLEDVSRALEWELHRLAEAWRIPVEGLEVRLDLYDDQDALASTSGKANAHASGRRMAMTLHDVHDGTLPHELVHAIDQEVGTPWYRVTLNRGISEGSAVAWADGLGARLDAHRVMAAALEQGTLPSAETVMSPLGFLDVNESDAYQVAGSFIGWLVLTEGVESWHALHRSWDIEATYGRSLRELESEWRGFLSTVPRALEDDRRARRRFGRVGYPAYRERQCPKLGPIVPDLPQEAREAARASAHELALRHYDELLSTSDDERWRRGRVSALQELDRHVDALAALDAVPPSDKADVEAARQDSRAYSLAALGRLDPLRRVLDARLALHPDPELSTLRGLLDDVDVADAIMGLMVERQAGRSRDTGGALLRLRQSHPEHEEPLERLYLQWAARWFVGHPAQRSVVRENLERLEALPGACNVRTLSWSAKQLVQTGDCELAGEVVDVLATCDGPDVESTVETLRQRLAWERAPEAGLVKPCAI